MKVQSGSGRHLNLRWNRDRSDIPRSGFILNKVESIQAGDKIEYAKAGCCNGFLEIFQATPTERLVSFRKSRTCNSRQRGHLPE